MNTAQREENRPLTPEKAKPQQPNRGTTGTLTVKETPDRRADRQIDRQPATQSKA